MANKVPKKKKKHRIRRFIVMLLVLALIALAGCVGYNSLKNEYKVVYDSYTATIGTISNSLSFSGSLALTKSANYTASSAATVKAVYVQAGDAVRDGDKLIRLSTGETVKAEFDGVVNVMNLAEGDEVSRDEMLVQVADFTHMKVDFRVDEYDINSVKVGDACRITTTAMEQTYEGTISAINHISSSGGSVAYYTATVYVDVGEGIYPGMQVTVTLPQEEATDVVILKMDALSFDYTNSAYVYRKNNEAGELEQVPVEVGVSNGNYVEIVSGLKEGDEVYVESKQETESSGLLSSLFGSQQFNAPGGMQGNREFSGRNFQNSGNYGGYGSGMAPGFGSGSEFGGGGRP